MRLADILDEATMLLHENRHMVLAIAHALETHKTISGDYHHPSFLEVADRYHNEALLAHRQTGRVEVPLPVLERGLGQLVSASEQLPPPSLP
ncbi:MAG: hypothetical protein ACXVKP_19800 [Ilumatobacteraceae bacterium]